MQTILPFDIGTAQSGRLSLHQVVIATSCFPLQIYGYWLEGASRLLDL